MCVPSQLILLTGVTIGVVIRLRTGDKAIIIGALEIWAYEKFVSDDEDLISRRVAAYRTRPAGRLLTDAVILTTALHLSETIAPEFDVFHIAMKASAPQCRRGAVS